MDSASVDLCGDVHRLESNFHNSPQPSAERHRPRAAPGRSPIGSDNRRGVEVPALLHVVVNEPLKEELVHGRFIEIGMPGDRPDVVCKEPHRPWFWLHQHDDRGPDAEFSLPEKSRIRCGGHYQTRPDAPDYLALL